MLENSLYVHLDLISILLTSLFVSEGCLLITYRKSNENKLTADPWTLNVKMTVLPLFS